MAKIKILDIRDAPSFEPARFGQMDVLITYQIEVEPPSTQPNAIPGQPDIPIPAVLSGPHSLTMPASEFSTDKARDLILEKEKPRMALRKMGIEV